MADDPVWRVYKAAGKCGRTYIGVTKIKLKYRWNSHLCSAEKGICGPLNELLRERGADWFTVETICECYSVREAIVCERAMIAVHGTYYKQGGLNRNLGGGGNINDDTVINEPSVAGLRVDIADQFIHRDTLNIT